MRKIKGKKQQQFHLIKAIIFDCDGVILDSNQAYEKMYEELFRKYGVKKTAMDIYPHFGESPKHIMKAFFHGRKNIRIIYKDYIKRISRREFNQKIRIHKGAKNSITKLSKHYKIAVVSGALRFRLLNSLGKYGLTKYFLSIFGSDDVRNAKPNPEALNRTIKRLKVRKSEVIFIGDAPNDLRAARRAGIKFAAVLTGVLDKKMAKHIGADYVISDINKIGKLLKDMKQSTTK